MELTEDRRFPGALQPIGDRIRSHNIAIFHGNMNMKKLNFIGKWMIKDVLRKMTQFVQDKALVDDFHGNILSINLKGRNKIRQKECYNYCEGNPIIQKT